MLDQAPGSLHLGGGAEAPASAGETDLCIMANSVQGAEGEAARVDHHLLGPDEVEDIGDGEGDGLFGGRRREAPRPRRGPGAGDRRPRGRDPGAAYDRYLRDLEARGSRSRRQSGPGV